VVDLPAALRSHARLGLDTSIFIYHIQADSPFSSAADQVLEQLTQKYLTGVTSVLTLTELLVKPYQLGRRGLASRYEALVRAIPNLAVVDTDARIARQAAVLRATHQLRTADAVQVASSLENGATAFVTNDIRLRRITEISVIVLGDYVSG
jgi:predicted nucleic acid-binding protein